MALPELGELRYGNVQFGPYTRTTGVSGSVVETTDGRSVRYIQYTINFESTITGDTSAQVDAIALRCRRVLSKNGLAFVCTKRAVGDFRVNEGPIRDVNNGPKPKEVSFEPAVGGDLTAKLRWSISFCIPECQNAAFKGRAMDFSYTVNYTVANGYTTRTISGKLMIPQNRIANGERFSQDSADNYREAIYLEPPVGFKPQGGINVTLSEDRGTLSFSYAHVEMGRNIPPPKIVEVSASQTMSSNAPALTGWQVTISGNYEIAKDGQFRDALNAFDELVQYRLAQASQQIAIQNPTLRAQAGVQANQKVFWLPIAATLSDPEIYGARKVNLSYTFQSIGDLQAHLNSGIWTRLPGQQGPNAWRRWWLSVRDNAFHPRGYARLLFDVGDDRIVDLCDPGAPRPNIAAIGGQGQVQQNELRGGGLLGKVPPPQNSWLHYECSVQIVKDDGNNLVSVIPAENRELVGNIAFDPINRPQSAVLGRASSVPNGSNFITGQSELIGQPSQVPSGTNFLSGGNGAFNEQPAGGQSGLLVGGGKIENNLKPENVKGDDKPVKSRNPTYHIILSGKAARVYYEIPYPSILAINDVPVIPINDLDTGYGFKVVQKQLLAMPIFYASWRLKFGVVGELDLSKNIEVPQNILFPGSGS